MMKNILFFILLTIQIRNCLTQTVDNRVTVYFSETFQTITGFGAFAGRSLPFYRDAKRDRLLELLFSEKGLKLNVIRGTIFPDFNLTLTKNKLSELHQSEFWIMEQAKLRYNVNTFIASAWSPPYKWKTIPNVNTGANLNRLANNYYDHFAVYIADFINWYKRNGVELYAISPQNEPEFPSPSWDGCIWTPDQTSTFVKKHLKPALEKSNLSTKIIIGETSNWLLADFYLSAVARNLNETDHDIHASHGYSLPNIILREVYFNEMIYDWQLNKLSSANKERWITESCSTDKYDPTMKKAIQFATSLQKFLINGNVNCYIFWLSMMDSPTNEALIISKKEEIVLTKVYDVYGQFSRYIEPDSIRLRVNNVPRSITNNVQISAFKSANSDKLTIVIVNTGSRSSTRLQFTLEDFIFQSGSVNAYLTDEKNRWTLVNEKLILSSDSYSQFTVLSPALSVLTVTGKSYV